MGVRVQGPVPRNAWHCTDSARDTPHHNALHPAGVHSYARRLSISHIHSRKLHPLCRQSVGAPLFRCTGMGHWFSRMTRGNKSESTPLFPPTHANPHTSTTLKTF